MRHATDRDGLARASLPDTFALLADVILPTLGKGVLIRRPNVVAAAERFGLDSRGVRRLQKFRRQYGDGPLLFPVPGRPQALILSPEDVRRVLEGAPEPFAPSTLEKHSALSHFEPKVSLISHPPERTERRRLNDEILESHAHIHSMAEAFGRVVDEEADRLVMDAGDVGLDWTSFTTAWHRAVRRIVLGNQARDDEAVTAMLAKLRRAGNWAFLHPGHRKLAGKFHDRLEAYLDRAEPGSLVARIKAHSRSPVSAPVDQVTHWLFAFDPGGMATFRALALLAAHPEAMRRAREEAPAIGASDWPFGRACIRESLRLWPTTPVILRETTQDVPWRGGVMPKNTHVLIFAPFFHRDDENLPEANRFAPELWLDPAARRDWPLVPFSGGPGTCPAHHLVPMLGSMMIAAILARRTVRLHQPERLLPSRPLPGTLDNFSLSFDLMAA